MSTLQRCIAAATIRREWQGHSPAGENADLRYGAQLGNLPSSRPDAARPSDDEIQHVCKAAAIVY